MSDSEIRTYLKSHPKILSTLFGLTVALSAAGPVVYAAGHSHPGP